MPPRPSSVTISNSPSVAACSRAATAAHGDVSTWRFAAVGRIVAADDAWAVRPAGPIGVPQLPQKRSPGRTAPPQLGHVAVDVGVIVEVAAKCGQRRCYRKPGRFVLTFVTA